jgi:hypothetical protein
VKKKRNASCGSFLCVHSGAISLPRFQTVPLNLLNGATRCDFGPTILKVQGTDEARRHLRNLIERPVVLEFLDQLSWQILTDKMIARDTSARQVAI